MKKKILVDLFFLPQLSKFYSFNMVASELLLLLSSMGQYEIDVIVSLGDLFQTLEGEEAAKLVWDRYYEGVFPSELHSKLKINKAIAHAHFQGHMQQYDVLIQMVSCYQLRQSTCKSTIVIHYDLIPVEGLYDIAVRHVVEPLLTNINKRYLACISKPVEDRLTECLPDTRGYTHTLPITFQHLSGEQLLDQASFDFAATVSRYASPALDQSKLKKERSTRYILQIGSFEADFDRKNHALTLAAWEKYKNLFPEDNVKLVLVGGVQMGNDELFAYHNLGYLHPGKIASYLEKGEIVMLTKVDQEDIVGLLNKAQCLVLPSKLEGFGMPVIEAMHCGCPVVVSDIEIFRWVAGDAALFCDPYRVDSLLQCMIQLLSAPDCQQTRGTLVAKGYENIKRFSPAQVMPVWEQFIETITQTGSLELV